VGGGFRRILWAPRFLDDGGDTVTERDPLAIVARHDRELENDTVVGDTLSAFAEFLILHLKRTGAPTPRRPDAVAEGAQVKRVSSASTSCWARSLASTIAPSIRIISRIPATDR
jgi:hypothetical protein